MIDSIVGAPFSKADAVVIGVPYEETASFGEGASAGPQAVINVLHENLEFFDRYTHTSPAYDYAFSAKILDEVKTLSPEKMVAAVKDIISKEQRFFVLLGGVHSVSIGALQALAEKHNPSEITIVQIDAHFDIRNDDSDYNDENPGPYAHSTVMRRAHELGFQLLPIGVRTMSEDEYTYVHSNQISFYEWGRADIQTPTINEVISSIKTDKVYLTIDVDGFDPSVMPGTGTPVSGGISWEYGEALIRALMQNKEVIAGDIVEIAPMAGNVLTEYNAAQLVYHMLSLSMLRD